MRDAIGGLAAHLSRSLTWDQGIGMAHHAQLRVDIACRSTSATRTACPWPACHQREHQRPPGPVLPEGNQPRPPQRLRPRRGRHGRPGLPAEEDPRLEDARRGAGRAHRGDDYRPLRGPVGFGCCSSVRARRDRSPRRRGAGPARVPNRHRQFDLPVVSQTFAVALRWFNDRGSARPVRYQSWPLVAPRPKSRYRLSQSKQFASRGRVPLLRPPVRSGV